MNTKHCTRCKVETKPVTLKGYRLQIDDGRKVFGSEITVTSCPECGQLYFWNPTISS